MHPWFVPLVVIFILAAMGLIGWLVILINKKPELKEEKDFYLNFCKYGTAYGQVEELEFNENYNRWKFKGEARDRSVKSILENAKPKKAKFVVPNVITLPRNKWSPEKNVHILYPKSSKDLPKELKETEFGKAFAVAVELANADNIVVQAMEEGIKRLNEHVQDLNIGEATKEIMLRFKEAYKDLADFYKEKSKKDILPTTRL